MIIYKCDNCFLEGTRDEIRRTSANVENEKGTIIQTLTTKDLCNFCREDLKNWLTSPYPQVKAP